MNFETTRDINDKKYIWLADVQLQQGLKTIYSVESKEILILDPDKKDYQGNDYTETLEIKEDKVYGVVQRINSDAVLALSELIKVLRTL